MTSPLNILVLGATGATGLKFVEHTLEKSAIAQLVLFVRSTSKLRIEWYTNPRIRILQGALNDPGDLEKAMKGINVVVSFLGAYLSFYNILSRSQTTPIGDSFPKIIDIMRMNGVKRILVLSTPTAYPIPEDKLSIGWQLYSMLPIIFAPQGNAEMKAIASHVSAQEDLDWTVMRISHLTDGSEDLPVAAGPLGPDFKGTENLSRASLVKWALEEVNDGKWIKAAPVLGNYV